MCVLLLHQHLCKCTNLTKWACVRQCAYVLMLACRHVVCVCLTHHSGLQSDSNAAIPPASVNQSELLLHHSFLLCAVLTHHFHSTYTETKGDKVVCVCV